MAVIAARVLWMGFDFFLFVGIFCSLLCNRIIPAVKAHSDYGYVYGVISIEYLGKDFCTVWYSLMIFPFLKNFRIFNKLTPSVRSIENSCHWQSDSFFSGNHKY